MHYNTQTYLQLKEQRKHKLFIYSMLLALLILLVNITMDYLLTNHVPLNAVIMLLPMLAFFLIKQFCPFKQGVYRSFHLVFIIAIIEAIINARPEQATPTYWAYLIIITVFTYEDNLKNAIIVNGSAFISLGTLAMLNHFSYIQLPYSQFNYFSFLMIYVVLSIFVLLMVKNFTDIETILHQQSQALQNNVDELNRVQQHLIETEKMAALGGLVAGISHEINTPLGIALTAITHNQDILIDTEKHLQNKTLKQSILKGAINSQQQGYRIILKNLERANNLIGHFKQVAVDQASENLREIFILEYLQETVESMYSLLKHKNVKIHVNGPENIKVNTYPGPIYQIISNLINNSVLHGFELQEEGNIDISVSLTEQTITLYYLDDGIGMSDVMLKKIYDPFVTSKRNQGGSGLGMNIVYNLVTQVLEGEIDCHSNLGEGVEIKISFVVDVCPEKTIPT
ncbi:MAG: HAMP domain-containing histidine kinase [Colwellia sp.]|nr:HAMP domain-containing histidine kinase [Colwellia sp.]